MDPYIPHLSAPVNIDSVASRRNKLIKLSLWLLVVVMTSVLGLLVVERAYADSDTSVDRGEVVIYRVIHSRPAIRKSAPEEPVAVNTGSVARYSGQVSDSDLADISAVSPSGSFGQINTSQTNAPALFANTNRDVDVVLSAPRYGMGINIGGTVTSAIGSGMGRITGATGNISDSVGSLSPLQIPSVR